MTPAIDPGVAAAAADLAQLREAMEAAASYSQSLMGWALLVIGGSVLALMQKSYYRPAGTWMRLLYALFVVGWGFLAYSIYNGTRVHEAHLGVLFQRNPDRARAIVAINGDMLEQVQSLRWGLLVFGFWLVIYLGWWIWHTAAPETHKDGKKEGTT